MPIAITMPQLSDTMTEGTVVKWLRNEGDKVKAGEVIAEVETDKATMEMEAFEGGTIAHVAAPTGTKVKVGDPIAFLASAKENPADVKKQVTGGAASSAPAKSPEAKAPAAKKAESAGSSPAASQPTTVATMEAASSSEIHEADEVGHHATREPARPVPPVPAQNGHGEDRILVSPLAKRIAADSNIDLSSLRGSGPNGRIIQKDIEAAIAAGPVAKAAPSTAPTSTPAAAGSQPARPLPPAPLGSGQKEVIPMTKLRTAIATALQKSKQTIPHFYETIDIDVEELSKLRERINQQLEKQKIRLSIADFITKAVASALIQHPALNARFNSEKNEITRYGDVNLGIAVSIPDGLIVPVLRNVHLMGLKDIRTRSADLIDRARAQRLKREEQTEGTFTISSLGTFGIREFSAIINPPEVGILAVGAAEPRAVVRNGQVVPRTMMTVTLSCDHRVVDGAVAADFLKTLKQLLEEPAMMLV